MSGDSTVRLGTGGSSTSALDFLYAWTTDGEPIAGFPIRVFDPAAAPWPTFRGGNARTGVVEKSRNWVLGSPVGSLFLSFSESSHQSAVTGLPAFQPFSWYVRTAIDFGDIGRSDLNGTAGVAGWEGALSLPSNVAILSKELVPATSMDLAPGAHAFQIGFGGPCITASSSPFTLVRYTGMLTAPVTDGVIRFLPPMPSSFDRSAMGATPGFLACGAPTDLYPFKPAWATSTLSINPSGQAPDPIAASSALISATVVSVLLDHEITPASLQDEANYEVWPTGSPGSAVHPTSALQVSSTFGNWVMLLFDNPLPGGVAYSLGVSGLETVGGHTMSGTHVSTIYDAAAVEDLVISEIMWNPGVKSDAEGEWFEVFNRGRSAVDLRGMTLTSGSGEEHVITGDGPLYVPSQTYRVLCRNRAALLDQEVSPLYEYGDDLSFDDAEDEIRIVSASGVTLDHVAWDISAGWPVVDGFSVQWVGTPTNDSPGEWATGAPAFGLGDHGTPGWATEIVTSAPPVAVTRTELLPSVPNPFNPRTEIRFSVATSGRVKIAIFDVRGRRLIDLVDRVVDAAGSASVHWSGVDERGRAVSSGVYFVRMWLNGESVSGQRVTLVR